MAVEVGVYIKEKRNTCPILWMLQSYLHAIAKMFPHQNQSHLQPGTRMYQVPFE